MIPSIIEHSSILIRAADMESNASDVLIIGGGASGLFAAARLIKECGKGLTIRILESGRKPCRKLLLTGSGRCNLSNQNCSASKYHTDDPDKLAQVLDSFGPADSVDFFENDLGVRIVSRGELYYPGTYRAATVAESLRLYVEDSGCDICSDSKVSRISRGEGVYITETESGDRFTSISLIIATGGASYPATGSDGNGIHIADGFVPEDAILPFAPALVPLTSAKKELKDLAGIRCSCSTKVISEGITEDKSEGEVLFTKDGGLSGICILDISSTALKLLDSGKTVSVHLNLMEADTDEVVNMLAVRRHIFSGRTCSDAFAGMLDKRILEVVMNDMRIDPQGPVADLKDGRLIQLANALCSWEIPVSGCEGIDNAQVSSGGIKLSALTPGLAVMDNPGLYIIGEACNVNGICGGFNLQWAWASAAMAARDIASHV